MPMTTVDVWAARLDAVPGGGVCCGDERDRAARFADSAVGARWLAAHHLVRTLLAERLGEDAAALEFSTGPHGKPSVRGIEFSLSHAGSIAVVAISSCPVGVDVEVPRRIARPAGLARRLGLAADTPPPSLLRAWARTEALLKATGDGASGGLSHAEQRLAPDGWRVSDLDLGSAAIGAVAARGQWAVQGPRWTCVT